MKDKLTGSKGRGGGEGKSEELPWIGSVVAQVTALGASARHGAPLQVGGADGGGGGRGADRQREVEVPQRVIRAAVDTEAVTEAAAAGSSGSGSSRGSDTTIAHVSFNIASSQFTWPERAPIIR